MANQVVGEVSVQIRGKEHTLRPSFKALTEVEDKAGKGCLELAAEFANGKVSVKSIVAIIYGGLIGSGVKEYSFEQLADIIVEDGFVPYTQPAATFLSNGLRGNPEQKKTT